MTREEYEAKWFNAQGHQRLSALFQNVVPLPMEMRKQVSQDIENRFSLSKSPNRDLKRFNHRRVCLRSTIFKSNFDIVLA